MCLLRRGCLRCRRQSNSNPLPGAMSPRRLQYPPGDGGPREPLRDFRCTMSAARCWPSRASSRSRPPNLGMASTLASMVTGRIPSLSLSPSDFMKFTATATATTSLMSTGPSSPGSSWRVRLTSAGRSRCKSSRGYLDNMVTAGHLSRNVMMVLTRHVFSSIKFCIHKTTIATDCNLST